MEETTWRRVFLVPTVRHSTSGLAGNLPVSVYLLRTMGGCQAEWAQIEDKIEITIHRSRARMTPEAKVTASQGRRGMVAERAA